jgi:hypothetical protein
MSCSFRPTAFVSLQVRPLLGSHWSRVWQATTCKSCLNHRPTLHRSKSTRPSTLWNPTPKSNLRRNLWIRMMNRRFVCVLHDVLWQSGNPHLICLVVYLQESVGILDKIKARLSGIQVLNISFFCNVCSLFLIAFFCLSETTLSSWAIDASAVPIRPRPIVLSCSP